MGVYCIIEQGRRGIEEYYASKQQGERREGGGDEYNVSKKAGRRV